MENTYIFILFSIILLMIGFSLFIIYKMHLRYAKMHNLLSANSIELDKVNKLLIGDESSFAKMENKVDGIHTAISTQLIKGLMESNKEK